MVVPGRESPGREPAWTEVERAMVPSGSAAAPVDRAQLARMGKEVGEQALRSYVAVFCELLGERIERIEQVVVGQSADGLRAALDLKVSSDMLGATRLAGASADVVILLQSGEPVSPRRMAALRGEAETVVAALPQALAALSRPGPGAQPSSGLPKR